MDRDDDNHSHAMNKQKQGYRAIRSYSFDLSLFVLVVKVDVPSKHTVSTGFGDKVLTAQHVVILVHLFYVKNHSVIHSVSIQIFGKRRRSVSQEVKHALGQVVERKEREL